MHALVTGSSGLIGSEAIANFDDGTNHAAGVLAPWC